jgi:large subunit ribosomal protein L35
MPKLKTHSGASKRFKITATGKIKRKHAFKRHNLGKKENKQKKTLTKTTFVHKSDRKTILRMLNF